MQIIHIDADAFAANVERVLDPKLARRPVVVGNDAGGRGVVACACYQARALGIRSGMPVSVARRRAPQAVFVPGSPTEYERFSHLLLDLISAHAPLVEAASLDDFYLDVTGCERLYGGNLLKWGMGLGRRILGETGLPVSIGLGPNKLIARAATRLAKPGHAVLVETECAREFLAGMPVGLLPGVGQSMRGRLYEFGVRRVGQLAGLGEERLRLIFGTGGGELWRRSQGEFHEPVKPTALHRMIRHEHLFERDTADPAIVEGAAVLLAQRLAWDLRRCQVRCARAELTLIYTDGATASHGLRLVYPSNQDGDLMSAAKNAAAGAFKRRVRVRRICLASPFIPHEDAQFDFLQERDQKRSQSLYHAIDEVRTRHGFGSLLSARSIMAGGISHKDK